MTTPTNLEHYLAFTKEHCACSICVASWNNLDRDAVCEPCPNGGEVYRWPELHLPCLCLRDGIVHHCEACYRDRRHSKACGRCHGLGLAPNVTLEMLLTAARKEYLEVRFAPDDKGLAGARVTPMWSSKHGVSQYATTELEALMAAMVALLDGLEAHG